MEEPNPPQGGSQIQTFVFMDMESTGLPQDSPRITELSLVAVSRAHLLEMKESMTGSPPSSQLPNSQLPNSQLPNSQPLSSQPPSQQTSSTLTPAGSSVCAGRPNRKVIPRVPRVLHKYTRLYYPWKVIPATVEGVTGLSNEILEHLPSFTEASADALSLFLDLPGPVALVSHNGSRFDFPLLMAELKRVNCVDKFVALKCVDTLTAIRDIDGLIEREDIAQITQLAESFSFDNFEDELLPDELNPAKRCRMEESDEGEGSAVSNTPPSPPELSPHSHGNNHQAMEVSAEPLVTPVKNRLPRQTSMPSTPAKPTQRSTPGTPQPGTSGLQARVGKESSKVRRNLTYGKNARKSRKMPYKQSVIYSRLFDSQYQAHRAEEDCMALLTICGHYGTKLVQWADTFATNFGGVKPMWEKRKSFHTSQEG